MSVTFNNRELQYSQFIIRHIGEAFEVRDRSTGDILGMAHDCETAANISAALEATVAEYDGLKSFAARSEVKNIFLSNGGSLV